ncbi:hypothetical protein [Nocardioides lijunqiniae]|uniref:hypothetical protein n=1 Tax=Nocardioides lijunqiniae TaxID=2760832 RepID=UPI0018784A46|nr:hypothetical protein [Nocardioides lijunqiniae]
MIEVLMTCPRCDAEISVDMASAVLRMDVTPRAEAELLCSCPSCERPATWRIRGDLVTKLLFVGIEPLRLSEPSLPVEDRAPDLPPLTLDDLLEWHLDLAPIWTTIPWER